MGKVTVLKNCSSDLHLEIETISSSYQLNLYQNKLNMAASMPKDHIVIDYRALDDFIKILSCISNARKLKVEINGLFTAMGAIHTKLADGSFIVIHAEDDAYLSLGKTLSQKYSHYLLPFPNVPDMKK